MAPKFHFFCTQKRGLLKWLKFRFSKAKIKRLWGFFSDRSHNQWVLKIGTSRGVWLTRCLMRTQESTNPAVTKGTGKEQWQAKHMSSERDAAKLLPPHTCRPNSPGNWFLFRKVILQQDKVSRDWAPAGNVVSKDKIQKQSCTSREVNNKAWPW